MKAPRLLIVDDILENRAVLARRFERRGFAIVEAESGRAALDIIDREHVDVVLLDIMMPEMDGLEVLSRVRQKLGPSQLPVIMVTAKSQSADVVQALEIGANDYVSKPVDFEIALARVTTQVARKRAEDANNRSSEALKRVNEDLERRVTERTARLAEANHQLRAEIVQRQKSEERTQYLAFHDALTGLGNRTLFRGQLERALAEAPEKIAVLFIDLDGFKGVNDTLGHSIGDMLLRTVANRLRDKVGAGDMIARLGGDEFAIMHQGEPRSATTLASQILDIVAEPCIIDGHELEIGASIGIAMSDAVSDPEDILRDADLAMYHAKGAGRGTYRVFNSQMGENAQTRRRLENDLRTAFAHGGFALHYQPLISIDGRKVTGFEALLRWNHAERGMVPPLEFVPVAEEIGLIIPLGEWTLREACREAATWPDDIRVAVNLSSLQFAKGSIVNTVVSALASSGLSPDRLELEITESVLLEKTERNIGILNQLREIGVRISMDDFGTGYSSLSYLRSFRFDKIKIDQSFVRDVSKDIESQAIVRAITSLGSTFGMVTTAEGVETEEQFRCLDSEGCLEVQGKLFSMPVPAVEVKDLLQALKAAS